MIVTLRPTSCDATLLVLRHVGDLKLERNELGEAGRAYEEALALSRTIGNRPCEARSLCSLALLDDEHCGRARSDPWYNRTIATRTRE